MAMSSILLLCASALALVTVTWAAPSAPALYALEDAKLHFENFIQKYQRNYADESEKKARFQIFKENLKRINSLNAKSDHAVFDVTQFSDMSHEEFVSKISCLHSPHHARSVGEDTPCEYLRDEDIPYDDAPESFDWRDHEVVSPVKDQGICGSCYAFSAIGNIESQYAIKNKEMIRLSEQQIVDCDKNNSACEGGLMDVAFRYLINKGGSEPETDYPYVGELGTCKFDANKVKVKLEDCFSFNLTSQEKLKQLLYHIGPISIGIQSSGLHVYSKGIISDKDCDVGRVNHGVLLVGYGSENGKPFWIVKNSWGTSFGEDGYFKMQRGEDALSCRMMNDFMASAIIA